MKQNQKPRNRHKYVQTTNFLQWCKGNSVDTGQSFQQTLLELLDIYMQKNESQPKPHTLYENEIKIDHRSKCKTIKV